MCDKEIQFEHYFEYRNFSEQDYRILNFYYRIKMK
jgi:hypothetical protein